MTSPPYWGLRDYGHKDQVGLEATPEKYVENLVEIFNELKRVLKPTGTFFLNIDDTYYSGKGKSGHPTNTAERNKKRETINKGYQTPDKLDTIPSNNRNVDLRAKSMSMIPERVMMAMVENGWILRNKVIWNKPNPMPESVKDRFSTTWEYVYMFSLNQDYYFDLDSVREPHKTNQDSDLGERGFKTKDGEPHADVSGQEQHHGQEMNYHENGKNPGDSWSISTKSFSDAHFAVYPEKLCEKPIKAGCPKKVCSKCGSPYERKVKVKRENYNSRPDRQKATGGAVTGGTGKNFTDTKRETLGFESTCECDTEETEKGVILDPFAGAGTTGLVARQHNRDYIGIELNEEYAEMAENRIKDEIGGQPLDQFV